EVEAAQDLPRAGNQVRAERGERGAEPARSAGARELGVRRKLVHRSEAALEQPDLLRRGTLLRSEEPRRVQKRRQRVAEDGRGGRQLDEHLAQAGTAVHRRGTAETD